MPTAFAEFVDSNILIYEWDSRDPRKQKLAQEFVSAHRRKIVISSQVLQEVAFNLVKRLHIPTGDVHEIVGVYSRLRTVLVHSKTVQLALQTSETQKISFWDALILEAAVEAGCRTLFTEDLNRGQVIRGVKVVNPFT